MRILFLVPLSAFALSGCLAKTALDVVTAPVRIAGKAVDMATVSQSESDERRGRQIREREAQLGKLQRRYEIEQADCNDGSRSACSKAEATYAEMQGLMPGIPIEPSPEPR